ncbi:MAG TPA: CAP domain-containing protein [Pseudolabrys sp.]|jgi:uncharacterized protein YkwD|nr:CAP domain-containing protein [Pseudolabrys sp.]
MTRTFLAILCAAALAATSAFALDINSFRAQHKLPRLSSSGMLSAAAHSHARDMASRNHLDHNGFRERMVGSRGAENVAYGCADADCAYRMWAKSAGHRRNMLMKGITSYGIASATADNGRRYWVLELGN